MIARVLRDVWTHVGIGFGLDDGTEEYWEALAGRGVRGPIAMSDLAEWQAEVPDERRLLVWELPELARRAREKRAVCQTMAGLVTYSELALLGHWFLARFGWPLKDSPNRVICSELVSRILQPDYYLPCSKHPNHDSVTPGWLFEYLKGHRHIIRYTAGKLEGPC
jgi:hypothetical protein